MNCRHCGVLIGGGRYKLWKAMSGALAKHDPEYCPDAPNHAHSPGWL